ncbi:MAG: excinuclease ABC subunit UvrB [Candidatus Coatesbacteria bacterium]
MPFELVSDFKPAGDQPAAIAALVRGVREGARHQVLLGITGSGKTFTVASMIAAVNRPTLLISPNKTLAAQLYAELKAFFPRNAVGYFVSYYDYYQPEAYVPQTDTYIEKDAAINEELDRLRHAATAALFERRDVVIVASVSCIYGLGSPENYRQLLVMIERGERLERDALLRRLVSVQYARNDIDFSRGKFRARGDVVEIFPASAETAIRVEFNGDTVEALSEVDPVTGNAVRKMDRVAIYPAQHYVMPLGTLDRALVAIERELEGRVDELKAAGKLLEAQRIDQRTRFDLEMMRETGSCHGIENYSRHLDGRSPGTPPCTLLEYFPSDGLVVLDESHIGVPQLEGMFKGDRARKDNLVNYGFRLPSAYDNRPLVFEEFRARAKQIIYVSATPGAWELKQSAGHIVEQIVRPTGLMDPKVTIRPADGQVEDLLKEVLARAARSQRTLVTTLTKRMAEDLAEHLRAAGVKVAYLHSDVETLDRIRILRDLRLGVYDCLVGINLLREGLDLPEVSLVAILDADKEGFLRSERSLIQTMGRAARNVEGEARLYARSVTKSMEVAIRETDRRRAAQEIYNREHGITPETIKKNIRDILTSVYEADYLTVPVAMEDGAAYITLDELPGRIASLRKEMRKAANALEFERAARLRDVVRDLELTMTQGGSPIVPDVDVAAAGSAKPDAPAGRRPAGPLKRRRGSSSAPNRTS